MKALQCPACGEVSTFKRYFAVLKYYEVPLLQDPQENDGIVTLQEKDGECQPFPAHRYDGNVQEASKETWCDKCDTEIKDENDIELVEVPEKK